MFIWQRISQLGINKNIIVWFTIFKVNKVSETIY